MRPGAHLVRGEAPAEPLGAGQRAALLAMAMGVLLAPAAYLALVGSAAAFVLWRLLTVPALEAGLARGAVQEYIAWLLVSIAALAILLKPLVAPRGLKAPTLALTEDEAPRLHEFIGALCRATGAPAPARIELACDASLRMRPARRPLRLLRGEHNLRIGAAMMAGLSVRQFAGLVAREAGCFAQRDVALAEGAIADTYGWLQRVATEPDAWDSRLSAWGRSSGSLAMLLGGLGGLAALAPRRILWLLMKAVGPAAERAARAADARAGARQLAVAGSETFEADSARIAQLRSLWKAALIAARDAERSRLPDDLPALTLSSERRRRPAPAPESAVSMPAEPIGGIIDAEVPAPALLDNFSALCRQLTRMHYHAALGAAAPDARLISTDRIAAARAAGQRAERASRRFFAGELPRMPLPAPATSPRPPQDAAAAMDTLSRARAEMAGLTGAAAAATDALCEADRLSLRLARVEALLSAEFRFAAADFQMEEATPEALRQQQREVEQMERSAVLTLTPLSQVATRRLRCALDLLHAPEVETRIGHVAARRRRVERLWPAWRATTRAMDASRKLAAETAIAEALVERVGGQWEKLETRRATDDALAAVTRRLSSVLHTLGDAPNPFDATTLLRDTLPKLPGEEAEPADILEAARQTPLRLWDMYARTIAELTEHAEAVERALGVG